MNKLVAATVLAAVALAVQSAAACDWNREASNEQQVATSASPTQTPQTTTSAATQAPAAATEAAKPVEPAAPVVLVTDRH